MADRSAAADDEAAEPNRAFGADSVQFLRHAVATLAYRAAKVLQGSPADFADLRLASQTRTPLEIVNHLGDLMEWATRMSQGETRWAPSFVSDWSAACQRFFAGLETLDAVLASGPSEGLRPEVVFQGPVADALTHVGQLAILRGLAAAPIEPESFIHATIECGRVGRDQAPPKASFEGDASPGPKSS
jgi:hypothetical protein